MISEQHHDAAALGGGLALQPLEQEHHAHAVRPAVDEVARDDEQRGTARAIPRDRRPAAYRQAGRDEQLLELLPVTVDVAHGVHRFVASRELRRGDLHPRARRWNEICWRGARRSRPP